MQNLLTLSRRRFFLLLSAIGIIGPAKALGVAAAVTAPPAAGFRILGQSEVALLELIVEQIIPADADPGARDTRVVHYIDRVLAGEQNEKRKPYAAGLTSLEASSVARFGRKFRDVSFDQQTTLLRDIEQGKVNATDWTAIAAPQFFNMVWRHTIEGFYGSPIHGGNKAHASWKMIGYPTEH
ncbi:MAG TPA: gluconate 2-dehydrogenase subunit 3 family protein [Acidobacteriota bacterium]|jgi:gluconate 2-dehydrogenase gamma chain